MSDFDAEAMPVQRTVDAAAAAPVAGARTPWPFEKFTTGEEINGTEPSAAAPAAASKPVAFGSDLPEKLRKFLWEDGEANVKQIAEFLGMPYGKASQLAANCVARKRGVVRVKSAAAAKGGSTYALEPAINAVRAQSWAEAKRVLAAVKSSGEPSEASVAAAPLPAVPAASALRYALFNDGSLRLEAGDSALNLPPAQTRERLAYLQRVSPVLNA